MIGTPRTGAKPRASSPRPKPQRLPRTPTMKRTQTNPSLTPTQQFADQYGVIQSHLSLAPGHGFNQGCIPVHHHRRGIDRKEKKNGNYQRRRPRHHRKLPGRTPIVDIEQRLVPGKTLADKSGKPNQIACPSLCSPSATFMNPAAQSPPGPLAPTSTFIASSNSTSRSADQHSELPMMYKLSKMGFTPNHLIRQKKTRLQRRHTPQKPRSQPPEEGPTKPFGRRGCALGKRGQASHCAAEIHRQDTRQDSPVEFTIVYISK